MENATDDLDFDGVHPRYQDTLMEYSWKDEGYKNSYGKIKLTARKDTLVDIYQMLNGSVKSSAFIHWSGIPNLIYALEKHKNDIDFHKEIGRKVHSRKTAIASSHPESITILDLQANGSVWDSVAVPRDKIDLLCHKLLAAYKVLKENPTETYQENKSKGYNGTPEFDIDSFCTKN